MASLAKILFIADYIEPGRIHQDEELIRQIPRNSLDENLFCILKRKLDYLTVHGKFIAAPSLDLYDHLLKDISLRKVWLIETKKEA
ncbi:MAG: hypothetical protein AB1798_02450 [Spirochaetota bacterium]